MSKFLHKLLHALDNTKVFTFIPNKRCSHFYGSYLMLEEAKMACRRDEDCEYVTDSFYTNVTNSFYTLCSRYNSTIRDSTYHGSFVYKKGKNYLKWHKFEWLYF